MPLLSEMDGVDVDPKIPVFILVATNLTNKHLTQFDKQFLGPGRFDKMLYVGPCITLDDKELVVKALTKKYYIKKDVSTKKLVELIEADVTGASPIL